MSPSPTLTEALREFVQLGGGGEARATLAAVLADAFERGDSFESAELVTTALDDVARKTNRVSLVVTGLEWLGGGVRAIEDAVVRLVEEAERELVIATYSLTPGPARLWRAVERALAGGIRCTLVVDRLDGQHPVMRSWLEVQIASHHGTLSVADFRGEDENDHLHAKVIVADRRRAVVGSANLTAHGLLLAHELALLVEGPVAEDIADRVELLGRSTLVRRVL